MLTHWVLIAVSVLVATRVLVVSVVGREIFFYYSSCDLFSEVFSYGLFDGLH